MKNGLIVLIDLSKKMKNKTINNMTNDKKFWDDKAKRYNKILKVLNTQKPYRLMYEFIKDALTNDMYVLEVGTGTGLVAREIADQVQKVEATDFSEEMIARAKNIGHASNIKFSRANIFDLPFSDNQFDVVIAANILHIILEPEKAMQEIRRVLKYKGLLIAPTFLWKELSLLGEIQKFFMMKKHFPLKTEWNETTYSNFINNNGFVITKFKKIKTSFTIACVEAKLKG
ncbi:MAG: methyltransferase type 11 [Ignavibacteriae bacterium]|nr:MAG: methyltransferase type 11 [Ignavibacteriota bacterium]